MTQLVSLKEEEKNISPTERTASLVPSMSKINNLYDIMVDGLTHGVWGLILQCLFQQRKVKEVKGKAHPQGFENAGHLQM